MGGAAMGAITGLILGPIGAAVGLLVGLLGGQAVGTIIGQKNAKAYIDNVLTNQEAHKLFYDLPSSD